MTTPGIIEANLVDQGGRYALVVARFNDFITARLLDGALDTLKRHGADAEAATVVWVPGAVEIPIVCQKLARTGKFDAIIALGCVIRGGTPHFEYVSGEVSKGMGAVSLDTGVPISFGVLTVNTIEQAIERAGSKMGNKGAEAALSAIEMVGVLKAIG
jgi:6,7-dimethyl-8-ribityllumazine synthase